MAYLAAVIGILFVVGALFAWYQITPGRFEKFWKYFGANFETIVPMFTAIGAASLVIIHYFYTGKTWPQDITTGFTLAILAGLAYAILHDREKRDALIKEVRLATEGTGNVKIYTSWNADKVQNLIATARKSIEIVDSWFDEAVPLAHLVDTAITQAPSLNVQVYMADKNLPYGRQRLNEIGEERLKKINADSDDFGEMYNKLFDSAVTSLRIYVEGGAKDPSAINLEIFAHSLMPGIRIIAIDETEYLFSWFPLGGVSVKNVCFRVSTQSTSERDRLAARHLKLQLELVRKNSRQLNLC